MIVLYKLVEHPVYESQQGLVQLSAKRFKITGAERNNAIKLGFGLKTLSSAQVSLSHLFILHLLQPSESELAQVQ